MASADPPHSLDGAHAGRVAVADFDPALRELIGDDPRARGARTAVAHQLPRGTWKPNERADPTNGGYGLLVLDGLLLRRVGVEGRYGAELLLNGDLLRPWQQDG